MQQSAVQGVGIESVTPGDTCASLDLQNAAVLNVYHRLTQHKGVAPYDITILARNKNSLREVHRYLEINDVPARFVDRRVLEGVCTTLHTLLAVMEGQNTPLDEVLTHFGLAPSHANREALRTLTTTTDPLLKYLIGKLRLGKQRLNYESKFNLIADCLINQTRHDKEFIIPPINQLKRLTRHCPDLTAVRQVIRQYQQDHEQAVTLQTLHGAKGKEYKAVLIVDVVDGYFPDRRSMQFDQHNARFEEEKRLLYMGITRAKIFLCLLSRPYFKYNYKSQKNEEIIHDCSLLSDDLQPFIMTRQITYQQDIHDLFPLN